MELITEKQDMLFYQNLGQLFYAIAASDKIVRKAEFDTLKKLVIDYWKAFEEARDEYLESVTYQMEVVFEWFDYEQIDAQECFNNFIDYAKEHPKTFTKEKKKLITKTAEAIANAFAGKNKSELIMLAQLELFLNKL